MFEKLSKCFVKMIDGNAGSLYNKTSERLQQGLPAYCKGVFRVIKIENHLGNIEINDNYFSDLIGHTVTSCFGVAGMANSGASQGLRSFFFRGRNYLDQGVQVKSAGTDLLIDLHIIVTYGVNISAIVDSIVNKVRYTVEQATGLAVHKVNVYVDGMTE